VKTILIGMTSVAVFFVGFASIAGVPLEKLILLSVAFAGSTAFLIAATYHAEGRLRQLRGEPREELFTTRKNRSFPKELLRAAERLEAQEPTPADNPPLTIGDECQFVHGIGPVMMVVDANEREVIGSWEDGYQEHKFPRSIVRRYRPSELVKKHKVTA
jgi:hypothetical protein